MAVTCENPPKIDPENLPPVPETVTIDTVTEGCVDGNGIYDEFMKAHVSSLNQEYKKQRITGPEYSQVYLGGMQAAMAQAVGFALGKDKAAVETELARYQMEKVSSEVALINKQICLVDAQIEEMQNKAKLAEIQCWTELAKISSDISIAAAEDVDALRALVPNSIDPASVFGSQIEKTKAEEDVLISKKATEDAQTKDTAVPESVLGKQMLVHQRQADGFLRKSEADLAQVAVNAHSVQFSTLDGEGGPPPIFENTGIERLVGYLEDGVNGQPTPD